MPHRFKNGDPVFYTSKQEEFKDLNGIYTVEKANSDGTAYRIVDEKDNFTDADESEIEHLIYAVFTTVKEGWPIIVPTYEEPVYTHFLNCGLYKFQLGGPAAICIKEQILIFRRLEENKEQG